MNQTKHDNFKRIAEKRTNRIIEQISKLYNLSNPSFYEYTDSEINGIFDSIQEELNHQKALFSNKKKGTKKKFEL